MRTDEDSVEAELIELEGAVYKARRIWDEYCNDEGATEDDVREAFSGLEVYAEALQNALG